MKKIIALFTVVLCLVFSSVCYADTSVVIDEKTNSKLVELKDNELKTMEDYKDAYGSDSYGITAYILNKVRIFSIPLGFLLIAIGAIYQYILGIRKLDVRDKGFALVITSVTALVICQVLPLVFAVVVKGWRG